MKSPIQQIEEWLFKIRRTNLFQVFHDEVDEAKRFRETVEDTDCPACKQKKLELAKFERGPKGWEIDLTCGNCDFTGVVSALSTTMLDVNSKGKAVTTSKRKATT